MIMISTLCCLGIILGVILVASNPSPYFGALGLVLVAGSGCGVLMTEGGSFLALILFLIYLGGMLVVFAYTCALAAEPYPETWVTWQVFGNMCAYLLLVVVALFITGAEATASWVGRSANMVGGLVRGDTGGVALMYSWGGAMLITSASVLLLTLFVVVEVVRGMGRGSVRAI